MGRTRWQRSSASPDRQHRLAGWPASLALTQRRPGLRVLAALGPLAAALLTISWAGQPAQASPPSSASPAELASGAVGAAPTVVTFTWGGGFANQLGSLPLYERYHMHATFYVPSGLVCLPSTGQDCSRQPYLSLAGVHKIASEGNEIGGLSLQHIPLTGLPAAEAQREICDDRVNLTRWGFRVTDFAYPFALVTHKLQTLTRRCGYNTGLGTGQLRGAGLCNHCPYAETIPPHNPFVLRTPIEVASVGTRWTAATFENIVEGAQSHGGGWVIFTVHDVCPTSCSLGVTKPELADVLAWLARQRTNGVSVKTVRQVVGGPDRPVVPGPPPVRIPAPGVENARLTTVSRDGVPKCFQTARYGTNHAKFAYQRHGGPRGAGAEQVTVTQRQSGTGQLLPTLDLGQCAPEVIAGRSYTVGAWYKATGQAVINVYYRTPVGTWKYWATSPSLSAEQRWTRARWTPPPVPAGASALSFSVAPLAAGTVTTSTYSLVRAYPQDIGPVGFVVLVGGAAALTAILAVSAYVRRYGHHRARGTTPKGPPAA